MKNKKDFIVEFLRERKSVGAIQPSSKKLTEKILKKINFEKSNVIVEYGPGTGTFTEELIRLKSDYSKLVIFELNITFFNILNDKYGHLENVYIYNESAEKVAEVLSEINIEQVDVIISSLPLAVMKSQIVDNVLINSHYLLSKNGKFIQYQYSLKTQTKLKRIFSKVKTGFTLRNIPPAFIYECSISE